ncbi:MAG: sugar phosphate isomerase/epimerase [Devosia sp.]
MSNYLHSFQLFTARDFPPIENQLETLAALGYDAVEPYSAQYKLASPKDLRAMCDANGLTMPSVHLPLAEFDKDRAKVIDDAITMGAHTVIAGAFPHDQRIQPIAGWQALGARLNEHAEALAAAGLKLAWHNHDFEFATLPDGSRPIDHLLSGSGMFWEPDLGWIVWGGYDIATELDKFPGKFAALHFRDVAPAGTVEENGWTDIGSGIIDWKAVWPAIERTGTDLLVVEHEAASDWVRFARGSRAFLSSVIDSRKA